MHPLVQRNYILKNFWPKHLQNPFRFNLMKVVSKKILHIMKSVFKSSGLKAFLRHGVLGDKCVPAGTALHAKPLHQALSSEQWG